MIRSFAVDWRAVAVVAVSFAAAVCTGQTREATNPLVASLIFDNASPDAREALTSSIDYRITEDNFSRWQEAQENLDQLPRSAIRSTPGSGRSAIDRANLLILGHGAGGEKKRSAVRAKHRIIS